MTSVISLEEEEVDEQEHEAAYDVIDYFGFSKYMEFTTYLKEPRMLQSEAAQDEEDFQ